MTNKVPKRTKPAEQLGFELKGHGATLALTQHYEDRIDIEVAGKTVAIDAQSFWAALDTFRMVTLPSDWPGHINAWKPRFVA